MNPIDATVRLLETWSVTGRLNDLNTGQIYDLTEQLLALFSGAGKKPRAKREPVEPPSGPVHVVMDDPRINAQAPPDFDGPETKNGPGGLSGGTDPWD